MKVFRYFFCKMDSRKVSFDALTTIRVFREGSNIYRPIQGESAGPGIIRLAAGTGSS